MPSIDRAPARCPRLLLRPITLVLALALLVTGSGGASAARGEAAVARPATHSASRPPAAVAASAQPAALALSAIRDQLGGVTRAVAVSGHVAFVGVGPRVVAVDLTDPAAPSPLGRSEVLPGVVVGIALADGRAYVAAEAAGGLRVFDVRDPSDIRALGSLEGIGDARRVAVVGDRAYVGAGASGLVIVDVADPAAPRVLGTLGPMAWAAGVQVVGDTAYVTQSERWEVPNGPGSASINTKGDGTVALVDVADPAHPRLRATVPASAPAPATTSTAVTVVVGSRLYIASAFGLVPIGAPDDDALRVYDVADPDRPLAVARVDVSWRECFDMVADVGRLLLACDGLRTFDLTDPDAPVEGAALPYTPAVALALVPDAPGGAGLIAVDDFAGLAALDVADPAQPVALGRYRPPSAALGVAVDDRLAALTEVGGDLSLAARDARGWSATDRIHAEGPIDDVALADRRLHALRSAEEGGRLDTFDLRFDAAPIKTSTLAFDVATSLIDVDAAAARAIVLGLRVVSVQGIRATTAIELIDIDLSDGSRPVIRAASAVPGCGGTPRYDPAFWRPFMAIHAGRVYVTVDSCGVPILDWPAGAGPALVGEAAMLNVPMDSPVVIDGTEAFVTTGEGLAIFDVADPTNPKPRGRVSFASGAHGNRHLTVVGDRAFVAVSVAACEVARVCGGPRRRRARLGPPGARRGRRSGHRKRHRTGSSVGGHARVDRVVGA